jgi:hypothetical protein
MIRWPGRIKPGQVSHEIVSGLDWCPTLLAAAGDPDVKQKLLTGYQAAGKTFKVHLDGYNQLPYLTGQQDKSARPHFIYFNDDADLVAMRFANCLKSSARLAHCWFGASRSPSFVSPSFTTCRPIRSSGPTSPPIHIGIG